MLYLDHYLLGAAIHHAHFLLIRDHAVPIPLLSILDPKLPSRPTLSPYPYPHVGILDRVLAKSRSEQRPQVDTGTMHNLDAIKTMPYN